MTKLIRSLILLFLLISFPLYATATTYYVDFATGDNANNGLTTGTAWSTVAGGNSTTFVQGDLISLISIASPIIKVGSEGDGKDQFDNPQIGIWGDGTYLYITDTANSRVVKRLLSDLSYVAQCGSYEAFHYKIDYNEKFNYPHGIWGDSANLYIMDMGNHRIIKRLASDLSYVSKSESLGSGDDDFNKPEGICSDGTNLYIADTYNDRIIKRLISDLSYVAKIGSTGSGNDQFDYPRGIYCDGTHIYITDENNDRIVKRLASDLSYVAKIGSVGSGNDQFDAPKGIWGDGTYLYITDTDNHRVVKRLASDLSYVDEIGTQGSGDFQFELPGSNFSMLEVNRELCQRPKDVLLKMLERSPFADFVENFRKEYGIDLILDEDAQVYIEEYACRKNTQVSEAIKRLLSSAWALNYMGIKGPFKITRQMVEDTKYFDKLFTHWYEGQKIQNGPRSNVP